ncbi:MAG: hypothetical protein WA637_11660 [Terriglobales bacterium]
MLDLGGKLTLDGELSFQVIKLAAMTLENAFARGIKNCKVRISGYDFSPQAEKHPRVQDNHRKQKGDNNASER